MKYRTQKIFQTQLCNRRIMEHLQTSITIFIGFFVLGSLTDATYCNTYHPCARVGYLSEKFYVHCSFWKWGRCTKYRQKSYTYYQTCKRTFCCSGYTGSSCSQAVCHGFTSCQNGGTCTRPNYCTCKSGFASPDCKDINECLLRKGGCHHSCRNTHGSFQCSCRDGFSLFGDKKSCIDINECLRHNGGCNHICTNTAGSYKCNCKTGFSLGSDGRTCTDINECLRHNGGCNHICTNTAGSYKCNCKTGFSLGSNGRTCTDANECLSKNGGCDQLCFNEYSGYRCDCKPGYKLENGSRCVDINECLQGGRCAHSCQNTVGSFKCSCRPGFILSKDGTSCDNVNDCAGVTCLNGGSCKDLTGSYSCKCAAGYKGKHCETDINECLMINGGCEDTCINTIGSFHCQCQSSTILDIDGLGCKGNSTNRKPSIFETHKIPQHLLPRGCNFITVMSCNNGIFSYGNITLSSTSAWYNTNSNSSIFYTFGVVFMEKGGIAIPVSISGVQLLWSESNIELKFGSLQYSEKDGRKLNNKHPDDCFSFSITPKYIRDMIASFLPTIFNKLNTILPDWIRFSSTGFEVLSVTDLKTDLLHGKELAHASECNGAPVLDERLYNVFRFGTEMAISLYSNRVQVPKPLRGNKFCVIIDICEDMAGTVFLIVPPESRNFLDHFDLFKSLNKHGLTVRPHGVGFSILKNINVHYKTREIQLWNGDNMFHYPTFPLANVWMYAEVGWKFKYEFFGLDVRGGAEMFFSVPKISNLLAGIFVDEWDVMVQLKSFSAAPSLTFKIFNEDVVIKVKDAAVASFKAYLSIGGSSNRSWCGDHANPEGAFVSFMVDVNPFRYVPVLRDWVFDLNVRLYAFLTSSSNNEPNENTRINVLEDIVNLKNIIERFGKLLIDWLNRIGHTLSIATKQLFQVLGNIITFLVGKVVDVIKKITNFRFDIGRDINSLSYISTIITRQLIPASQHIINAFEFDKNVIKYNITKFIENEKSQIRRNIDLIISKVMNQIISAVTNYNGFGLKFSAFVKILGFEFADMDVEMVYSVDRLSQCSKFRYAYNLLKDEPSVKLLTRVRGRIRLGFFIILREVAVSHAYSTLTVKFVVNFNAQVSILGMKVTGDILINNQLLMISFEGNIWGVYFASVTALAEVGKKWNDLSYTVKGDLLVKRGENDFGGSYLDGIRILAQKIANKANERITESQNGLTSAQKGLSFAQRKLTTAQAKVWKCNKKFDAAVRAMDKAKEKLEKAKGPFRVAIAKLNKAQRNVDNLCRIRTCHSICVPGVKIRMCKKGWFPYPCFRRTNCMFRLPNIACHVINVGCYAVRGLAYVALEAAKFFVRVPMLALDVAKGLVSAGQFLVDKARVVLVLANGVLEVAKFGLETVKGAIEVAKIALEGVKFVVRAAFYVFEMIIKYGLQNLIDVKNCKFELVLTKSDKAEFDVSCEIKAFGLSWHKFGFEFDFRHPLVSMWNIAKSTINTLIDMLKDVFGKRRKRDISYMSMTKLHYILRVVKRDVGNENATNVFLNNSIYSDEGSSINFSKRFNNRVEYFTFNCKLFLNIHTFLLESVNVLFAITNESTSALNDVQDFKQSLDNMDMNITFRNFTAESFGISPEYALRDYNLTEDDLQVVLNDVKDSVSNDEVLNQMSNSTDFAREAINSQLKEASSISIIDNWLYGLRNHSEEYFNETECVGFQDCVLHSFFELYDIFSEKDMINSSQNQNATSNLEDDFLSLFQNRSKSIEDAHRLSSEIIHNLNRLNETNVFCSQAPIISNELQNITVLTGSQVHLQCNVKGDPQPEIEWYHNDTIMHDENMISLELPDVTEAQEGLYKCKAGNIVTNVSSNIADVTIKECPPGTYYKSDSCYVCERGFLQPDWNQRTCKACPLGYTTESTGSSHMSSCSDIDECIGLISVCEQRCINTNGSYSCGCNDGYMLTSDGKSCKVEKDVEIVKIAAGVVGGLAFMILFMFGMWKLKQKKNLKIRPRFSNDNNDSKGKIETSKQRPASDFVRKPVLKQSFFQTKQSPET